MAFNRVVCTQHAAKTHASQAISMQSSMIQQQQISWPQEVTVAKVLTTGTSLITRTKWSDQVKHHRGMSDIVVSKTGTGP
jgi:hypothetical protein